jgi:dienelactone hydrolase
VGFCYGGLTVLELARSGANLKVAVSYHGDLRTHARAEPGAAPSSCSIFSEVEGAPRARSDLPLCTRRTGRAEAE